MERHEKKLEEVRRLSAEVVFLGDSITQNYEDPAWQPVWNRYYGDRSAVNLGFSADSTANVLWRIEHGELGHLRPRLVVVMIGTNNSGLYHWTAPQTEEGIDAVVAEVHKRVKAAHILLLGILPTDMDAEKRTTDEAVNSYLGDKYKSSRYVTFMDVGSVLLSHARPDPSLYAEPICLHPNPQGQEKVAQAIEPTVARLLHEPVRETPSEDDEP
jgi:lysophospholipase L1-like esterase